MVACGDRDSSMNLPMFLASNTTSLKRWDLLAGTHDLHTRPQVARRDLSSLDWRMMLSVNSGGILVGARDWWLLERKCILSRTCHCKVIDIGNHKPWSHTRVRALTLQSQKPSETKLGLPSAVPVRLYIGDREALELAKNGIINKSRQS